METHNISSEFEVEFEHSPLHWSKIEGNYDIEDDYNLATDNLEVFHSLQEDWPSGFFQVMGDEWEVGRKFAEGGQAEIYEVERTLLDGTKDKWVLKMFKHGMSLRDLMRWFPEGMLRNLGPNGHYSSNHCCSIYGVMMLQDGRFAILLEQYWGDLQKLIDLKMQLSSNLELPFPDMSIVIQIMLDIALGMQALHEDGIIHRDLKAANVFIWLLGENYDPIHSGKFKCHIEDFEVSVGVWGTCFWRAPEILFACKSHCISDTRELPTEKSDVYSFAMTIYEILTGHLPFEGHVYNDYDLVLQGARLELPETTNIWIKELLGMCWHQDPLQRPSFKDIVDILKAKGTERREPNILPLHSSTWEELNDPRVSRDQDLIIGIPKKFPILIEMLAGALQCCKEEIGKIKRFKDQVGLFKFQCAHLVTSLSSNGDEMFCRFHQVQQILKQPVITNAYRQRLELNYWFMCVAFGIHSLVNLTCNFQIVVEMLSKCGADDWWKTTFQYSTTPPHPHIPRWSVFGLALQKCQWSMDIVHLAINKIIELANGLGDWMFNDLSFQWCDERQRVVLQTTKELSSSLKVAATLEAQDRDELLKKLEMFLYKSLHSKSHRNEFRLASFLMTKLAGPTPKAKYLPYTFQIDPPVNLVSRSQVTTIWCDKILCHVKKFKGQAYEVRKLIEMDAAPLAAVQHPNVVHLIGCTFQTSQYMTDCTDILTKLVFTVLQ